MPRYPMQNRVGTTSTTVQLQEEYWKSIAERRSPFHPVVSAFAAPKLDFIRSAVEGRGLTMLEVGAGNGFFSATFCREFDLTCLDFSENMLDRNPIPTGRKVQGLAETLPFRDGSFDVVFCGNLLHHLEEPVIAVREMARVARSHVVLLEPNAHNPLMFLFGLLRKPERGTLKFTPSYLKGLGAGAGLSLRSFTAQGFILPNKTPAWALPACRAVDRHHPLAFYCIAIFDKRTAA